MRKTIGTVLPETAAAYGDRTALVCGDRRFTFGELERLAGRAASALADLGVARGDRVTLYARNGWEWVVAYYAIAMAGGVVNPVNAMLTASELAYAIEDCGAKALFADADGAAPVVDALADSGLKEIVAFGPDAPEGTLSFDSLLAGGADGFGPVAVDPGDLSTICYTSGTTGFPKGAMLSHRNVLLNAAMTAAMNMRVADDVQITALPCPHVYGAAVMNLCMTLGSTFVLLERFDADEMMAAIARHRATVVDAVPTMYFYMLASPAFGRHDLSSLRCAVVGGQTMPIAKSEEWMARVGCPVLELWGMTELAGPGLMQHSYGENRLGSVGIEMPYLQARVVDPEDASRELPCGEVGELMVSGPLVMMGYYGNEEATRETIEPDGWLHSGDLARMDEDRHFYVVDRKKDMILTAGYNVYPAEIERVISGYPAVAMVGVGARPDADKGEIAKAYVVLKPDSQATPAEIEAHCRAHLAAYKVPREVQIVGDLPTTSTGKILRRELHTLDAPAGAGGGAGS